MTRLLMDTHCWIWWLFQPERLNRRAIALMSDPRIELVFSAASSWEVAIKFALGKIELPGPPETYVPSQLASQGITALPIEHRHALRTASLPPHHNDPFDRLIIAQSLVEKIPVLTADKVFEKYKIKTVWAGL